MSKETAKPKTKTELIARMAEQSNTPKGTVQAFFDALEKVMAEELGPNGPGVVQLPGLVKITKSVKPAKEAGIRPNPFKKGEMMEVKAQPAKSVLSVRMLKTLKEMAV